MADGLVPTGGLVPSHIGRDRKFLAPITPAGRPENCWIRKLEVTNDQPTPAVHRWMKSLAARAAVQRGMPISPPQRS
jgi:glutathione S-transferase